MDAGQWQQIERIYRAARERGARDRIAFLEQTCAGDDDLKREVESLLTEAEAGSRTLDRDSSDGEAGDDPGPLAPGDHLGRFRIVSQVGLGGMGRVYLAFDPLLDRSVALKVLPAAAVAPHARNSFVNEARASASLNHPNIAQIYEIGEAVGSCYIAMEFVEGETLRQKLRSGASPLPVLLDYLRQTAGAMAKAHATGVVHCDLKPDNIMVTRDGIVKVLDFGLARLIRQFRAGLPPAPEGPDSPTRTLATDTGLVAVAGTIGYMSPEQVEGTRWIDGRSDIFSFGCLLFEAVARELPFSGETKIRTLYNLLYQPAPPLTDYVASAPPGLQELIDRCLEKNPEQRCRSMEEVSRELAAILQRLGSGDEPVAAPAGSPGKAGQASGSGLAPHFWSRRRNWVLAAMVVTAPILLWMELARRAAPVKSPVIAVLPFVNATGAADREYLSDGFGDGLVHALAQWPGARVVAGSSSSRFKGQDADVIRVARALRAQFVVTGRITAKDGTLGVSAGLTRGSDGIQVWGARYETRVAGMPRIEAEIARAIMERLQPGASPAPAPPRRAGNANGGEAYDYLLRGRYHMQLYTPESRRTAITCFEQALGADPSFALAHAELAGAYRTLSGSAVASPDEYLPKAEAAARRALAADDSLAEAHAALADIRKDQWQWDQAGAEFRRALELNPNLTAARQGYAILLGVQGRHDEAVRQIGRALELDPLGLPTAIHSAAVHYNARRFAEALSELERAAGLDPSAPSVQTWFGIVYGATGRYAEAIAAYERAIRLRDDTAATQCYYGYSLARAGRRDEAAAILQSLERSPSHVPGTALAILCAALNDRERAIRLLERAFAERDPLLQYIYVEPHLDSVLGDPRVRNLASKMGLPGPG